MLTKIKNKSIFLVLILAIFIRFYNLSSYPGLNPDEAALGYNAYSLIQTGKDEHGASWPLHFKSFGDFKPGAYVYLAIPFVKLFGLNELSVRLPSAILSILSIYFFYKLILLISKNKRLSTISALLLTISPWHIHFSRGAWEANIALSLIIISIYYFYKYLNNQKNINLLISLLLIVFSLYVYHSARLVAPLLMLSLFLINIKLLLKNFLKILPILLISALLCYPVLTSFLKNGGTARFGGVGITADSGPLWKSNELLNQHPNFNKFDRILHNKRVNYLLFWGQKYFSHYDFNYLFVNGDEVPRSKVPGMGQMYLIELPLLLLGIFFVLKSKIIDKKFKIFIFTFLFIAPIASSLTFQAPSALRSLPLTIPLIFFTSYSLYKISKIKTLYFIIIPFYIFSFLYYIDAYFIHYQKQLPYAWSYGFPELVEYTETNKNKYDYIYVSDKYDQPYIMFLFYSQYNPSLIQKEIKLSEPDKFGFSTVRDYNLYKFEKINWDIIPKNSLVVTSDENINLEPLKIINFPNNKPAFKIYQKI